MRRARPGRKRDNPTSTFSEAPKTAPNRVNRTHRPVLAQFDPSGRDEPIDGDARRRGVGLMSAKRGPKPSRETRRNGRAAGRTWPEAGRPRPQGPSGAAPTPCGAGEAPGSTLEIGRADRGLENGI